MVFHSTQSLRAIHEENGEPLLPRDHVHADDRSDLHFQWLTGYVAATCLCGNLIYDQGRI